MNSATARDPEPPTTTIAPTSKLVSCTTIRPNRLFADWRVSLLALVALWAVIYMSGLSRPALLDDADTVHAEAAKEMLQRHDWVTLYVNGVRYLEKAPLMYWGVASELHIVRHQRMEYPLPAHARRADDDSGDLRVGAMGARKRGRLRFGTGAGDRARSISIHTISDSGCGGGSVVDADVLAFSNIAGAGKAGPLDLLGNCHSLRAQRFNQRTDRLGVSDRRHRALSVTDWQPAASC